MPEYAAWLNLYDIRGHKTQTTDPDLGLWKYEYNALGELIRQTDAKAQVSTYTYDKLGRMTQRIEPGLTSDWTFDTATYGKGKLFQAKTNTGYVRTHSYDSLGRASSTWYRAEAGSPQFTHATLDPQAASSGKNQFRKLFPHSRHVPKKSRYP